MTSKILRILHCYKESATAKAIQMYQENIIWWRTTWKLENPLCEYWFRNKFQLKYHFMTLVCFLHFLNSKIQGFLGGKSAKNWRKNKCRIWISFTEPEQYSFLKLSVRMLDVRKRKKWKRNWLLIPFQKLSFVLPFRYTSHSHTVYNFVL